LGLPGTPPGYVPRHRKVRCRVPAPRAAGRAAGQDSNQSPGVGYACGGVGPQKHVRATALVGCAAVRAFLAIPILNEFCGTCATAGLVASASVSLHTGRPVYRRGYRRSRRNTTRKRSNERVQFAPASAHQCAASLCPGGLFGIPRHLPGRSIRLALSQFISCCLRAVPYGSPGFRRSRQPIEPACPRACWGDSTRRWGAPPNAPKDGLCGRLAVRQTSTNSHRGYPTAGDAVADPAGRASSWGA
jgi:hypothetical protein